MNTLRCRIKGYIQPFERTLALRELQTVAASFKGPIEAAVENDSGEFVIQTKRQSKFVASRLAYWEVVATASSERVTEQSLRESTVNVVRNGIDLAVLKGLLPFREDIPLPNRRCLRYGPHGIHEYRGKFFPQLVRSLINIAGSNRGDVVADPMSGSGTTLVEAKLSGCTGLGLDVNPLSTLLARTKCELLEADPRQLEAAYHSVRSAVLKSEGRNKTHASYFNKLPDEDQRYLTRWFAPEVLTALDEIALNIANVEYRPANLLMWISLSNILRAVSWQKNDDLRVRREIRLDVEIDPKKEFLEELGRSIRAVLAFLYQNGQVKGSPHLIEEADARACASSWARYKGKVDTVITSPPYATALPYLDTDRLSLCFLGLLSRPKHRVRDQLMIGNREVTDRIRRSYWKKFETEGTELLPPSVRSLIRKIDRLNSGAEVGFRRRNLPALLSKYFFDMRDVLGGVRDVLKSQGLSFVVVGNNHTIAGGERVEIRTAKLLSDVANSLGLELCESMSMDMLVSRDIFRKNALESEEILVLRRKRRQR